MKSLYFNPCLMHLYLNKGLWQYFSQFFYSRIHEDFEIKKLE